MAAKGRRKTAGSELPKPAPGELRLLQDLLATRDGPGRQDRLGSPALLADWLTGQGLLPVGVLPSAKDLARVRGFRDALRAQLLAAGRGRVDEKAIERVNRAAAGSPVEVRLGPDGAPGAHARPVDGSTGALDPAFGRWMSLYLHAWFEGEAQRLKICANGECRRVFYDPSRSRSRVWCCKTCGDRIRARAYRKGSRYRRRTGR